MRVVFTKHAKEAIEERGISEILVKRAVLNPDFTQPGRGNKTIYFKDTGKNYLKVVVVVDEQQVVVVTLHWIAKMRVRRYNYN